MLKIVFILIALFPLLLKAQQATNIRVSQERDNVVIVYDLTGGQTSEMCNIEITASDNNGRSFLIVPKSLSGDFKDVPAGNSKKIIWSVLNDMNELTGDGFVFKISVISKAKVAEIIEPKENPSGSSGKFTDDRDGEVYKWVRIGTQIWMAENLRTTKYTDGTEILNAKTNLRWLNTRQGVYCWYKNKIKNKAIYGALYSNWAVNKGICPMGWHVPSNAEWTLLVNYLGGEEKAGIKMKTTKNWEGYDNLSSNSSGFSGLPGGRRSARSYPTFYYMGNIGSWWTSTKIKSSNLTWKMFHDKENVFNYKKGEEDDMGYSVRCIKDN